jgi:hypothetical protein
MCNLWWRKWHLGRFPPVLRFTLPIIPLTAPHSSFIIWGGTIGQTVADISSGLSLTPPQEKRLDVLITETEYIGFGVITAVFMKNVVFWDVAPFGFCKN